MQPLTLLLTCFLICQAATAQSDSAKYQPSETRYVFEWGNNKTALVVAQYGKRKDLVMIHLHDDEPAALLAARKLLSITGGTLLTLENRGKRLVTYKKSGRHYIVDPNRIFTPSGIRRNLSLLNNHVTSPAVSAVKAFAAFILQKVPNGVTTLVAIHNNEDGAYSVTTYLPSATRAKDAAKLHINPAVDPDNFFIVTSFKTYYKLERAGCNVVLQNSISARDDGSLSVFCGRRNITYINVEAERNKVHIQTKMLRRLIRIS
jgi:hypothetical protein